MSKRLPAEIERVRLDLSDWLWHFTRRDRDPLAALKSILESGHIRGGADRYCAYTAVCFTEMPLTEAIRQSATLEEHSYQRFSDYGIGFRKDWIFSKGGLPVIYQPERMRDRLPETIRWRHCELDYTKGIDFTWQREWRVPTALLSFTADDDPFVVVRTEEEAMIHLCEDFCIDPERDEFYYTVRWSYVTHAMLAAAKSPRDVEVLRIKQG